jgi:NADH-quinone oxidoreductase subunit D
MAHSKSQQNENQETLAGENEISVEESISRSTLLNRQQFMADIEKFLGFEFVKQLKATNSTLIVINRARIKDLAEFIKGRKYKLEAIIASDAIDLFELNYIYNFYPYNQESVLIIQTQIDKSVEVPSIIEIYENADYYENNLTNRLGIQFTKKKIAPTQEPIETKVEICIPLSIQTPSASRNLTKNGIFHPIHEKSNYFEAFIEHGKIKKIELRDGWLYKQIQPKLEKRNPISDFSTIFNQIAATSSVHLDYLLYNNIEILLNKKLNYKVNHIRTLLAELERIISHVLWFANFSDILGYHNFTSSINKNLLKLKHAYEKYFNNGTLKNTIKYCTTTDLNIKSSSQLYNFFKEFGPRLFDNLYDLVYKSFTEEKCSHIGKIDGKRAIEIGLSGPALRGSGIPIDVRASDPYLNYSKGELSQIWNIITFNKGDVYARTQVRLWEIRESMEIVKNIALGLSGNEKTLTIEPISQKMFLPTNQHLYFHVEAPQGMLGMYLKTDDKMEQSTFNTVRLITPDAANYAASKNLLIDEEPSNTALIIHSLDINFHMLDL